MYDNHSSCGRWKRLERRNQLGWAGCSWINAGYNEEAYVMDVFYS